MCELHFSFPTLALKSGLIGALDQMADVQSEFRPITNLVHNRTVRRQVLWQTDTSTSVACPQTWDAVIPMSRPRSVRRVRVRALTVRAADRRERPRAIPDECRSPVTEAETIDILLSLKAEES